MSELKQLQRYPDWLERVVAVSDIMEMCINKIPSLYITITMDNDEVINVPRFLLSGERDNPLQELKSIRQEILSYLHLKEETQKKETL